MPPRDQNRDALNRRRSQVSKAFKNGIAASLAGLYSPDQIVLDPTDEQRLLDLAAKQGEELVAKIMAEKKAEMDQAKAEARAAALRNFGTPAVSRGRGVPEGLHANDSETETLKADLASEDAPEQQTDRTTQNQNTAQERPRASSQDTEPSPEASNENWNDGAGLQRCPHDGQILNPDDTCPAGDHAALGPEPKKAGQTPPPIPQAALGGNANPRMAGQGNGQTPPPIPPQARNPQTPPPIPPSVIMASIQAEGNKKMADLNKQLDAAKKQLDNLRNDTKKTDSKGFWLKMSTCGSCITIIGPIIGAIFLYLNYQKKGKIEKEIKRVEEQITNIEKERTETAKKYNLKI